MPVREYTCRAPRRTGPIYACLVGCLTVALLCWMPARTLPYPALWFVLGLLSLTAGLLLSTRYLSRQYTYRIEAMADGGFDFVVIEQSGRRILCVCRVSLDDLRALERERRGRRARVDYDLSLAFCRPAYVLRVDDGGGTFFEEGRTVCIRFEPDEVMADMIGHHLQGGFH